MDGKLKHLDLISAVIGRMSTHSFMLKGWSVTLMAALFALSSAKISLAITSIAVFLIVMFWGMDAFFLSRERLFRQRYDEVRMKAPDEIDFSMETDQVLEANSLCHNMFSPSLLGFYGVLLAAAVLFGWFL